MAADELSITGLTGVDMRLRVAGPGTRVYAFLIDWHIRALIVLAWVSAGLILERLFQFQLGWRAFVLGFIVPPALVYVFYHPVVEVVMRGRTPGMRFAGARIVTLEGATPGIGALLIRNVFRLVDMLPALYVVGLTSCLLTAQRVRVGDLAAGTVLVLDEEKSARSLGVVGALAQSSRLEPDSAALVRELLDRWTEMEEERAETLARELLARLDGRLDRAQVTGLDRSALRTRLEGLLVGG